MDPHTQICTAFGGEKLLSGISLPLPPLRGTVRLPICSFANIAGALYYSSVMHLPCHFARKIPAWWCVSSSNAILS